MSEIEKLKIKNIKDMIKELGGVFETIKSSELKRDYRRLLFFVQSNKGDLIQIVNSINKKIEKFNKSLNTVDNMNNKYVVMFWEKIRDIIYSTYLKNKEIDRSF